VNALTLPVEIRIEGADNDTRVIWLLSVKPHEVQAI
jgi:hypothetical protein